MGRGNDEAVDALLLVGEAGARVLEPFLKMVIWGAIPSTISCGLKLKNGVGGVDALWDI